MSNQAGTLYVVATPIGNLSDLSERGARILGEVDWVAAEDTRHSLKLFNHLGIQARLTALHQHNEQQKSPQLLKRLREGEDVALISDAGTPLISDPGFNLVSTACAEGVNVVPIPGPCAAIAALSASGLATDQFFFVGFLPQKVGARNRVLEAIKTFDSTLVFYLSVHRFQRDLEAIGEVLGWSREACLAREITKKFEQFYRGSVKTVLEETLSDGNSNKGEYVLVLAGAETQPFSESFTIELDELLTELLKETSLKQAVSIATRLTKLRKNSIYQRAQQLADQKPSNLKPG